MPRCRLADTRRLSRAAEQGRQDLFPEALDGRLGPVGLERLACGHPIGGENRVVGRERGLERARERVGVTVRREWRPNR